MISLNTSISDTCQKLWQGLSAGAEREPEAGALAVAGRWKRGGALEAELLKLFPAAEGRVISRSFRKLFKGLRRAGITRAARITSGQAAVTC